MNNPIKVFGIGNQPLPQPQATQSPPEFPLWAMYDAFLLKIHIFMIEL